MTDLNKRKAAAIAKSVVASTDATMPPLDLEEVEQPNKVNREEDKDGSSIKNRAKHIAQKESPFKQRLSPNKKVQTGTVFVGIYDDTPMCLCFSKPGDTFREIMAVSERPIKVGTQTIKKQTHLEAIYFTYHRK